MHRYDCEHVLAFLFDSRIDGYLEIGGTGVYTRDVIEYLLSLQEPDANGIKRWKLGRCDFSYQFQYAWENEDILNALFSVPKCFADLYLWTYETDSYPWTINLIRRETVPSCEVRYRRNQRQIKRGRNITQLCTRLYCLGSGEGVNQTNIREVNPTGRNYIEAASSQRHGVISKALIDRSISDPQTLFAKGQAYIDQMCEPLYSYSIKALDLHRMTNLAYDQMKDGRMVRVVWPRKGINFNAYIIEFEKPDVDEQPLEADVTISNAPEDISSTIESLSQKTAITAQYAQGATNLFPLQVMDNADPTHPAKLRFFLPRTCSKINTVLLSWSLSQFRAYETGAESGGGEVGSTLDGGGSTRTSSAGGAQVITVPQKIVDYNRNSSGAIDTDGGSVNYTSTPTDGSGNGANTTGASGYLYTDWAINSSGTMTKTGESDRLTSGSAGGHSHTVNSHSHGNSHTHSFSGSDTGIANGHTHKVTVSTLGTQVTTTGVSTNSTHSVSISGTTGGASAATGSSSPDTDSVSGHTHSVPSHTHSMSHYHGLETHTHTLGNHRHAMDHHHDIGHSHTVPSTTINIENHQHSIDIPAHSHSFTIPSHTHGIVYGIYEGGVASGVTIKVDGTDVPASAMVDAGGNKLSEIDVIPYMSMSGGKISRGVWHEIQLVPDKLTRIEANLFVQTFITSYTGGNY